MTVTNVNSRNDYISNGSALEYAFTFKILSKDNIQVIVADLSGVEDFLILDTDYTVDLDTDTGLGSITLTTAATVNYTISLLRSMDFEQNTSLQNQGTSQFPGKSFEQALDKLTLSILQLKENIARAILLPKSSLLTELEIPVNSANSGKALIVNAAGDNLDVKNLANISAAAFSTLGLSLVAAETAAAMRTLLNAQALNATLTDLAARVVGNALGNIPVVGSQSATTALAGTIEVLTNAELAAGSDTTRAATAAAIASLFGTSILGDTGELNIPLIVGGVFVKGIIKYGVANDVTSAGTTVTFANAFPTAMRRAFLTPFQFSSGTVNPASAQIMAGANSFSTTGFFISNSSATENRSWQWMAIGY